MPRNSARRQTASQHQPASQQGIRNLILILGDQLNRDSAAFDGFDPAVDRILMAEVAEESRHVWSSQPRTLMFLAAMRHFAAALQSEDFPIEYRDLEAADNRGSLAGELARAAEAWRPVKVIVVQPGDYRVRESLAAAAHQLNVPLEVRPDRHFLCTPAEFADHAAGRKQLRMEYFYREMRRRHGILMEDGEPIGGAWNYDADNRQPLPKAGPATLFPPRRFPPDKLTREAQGVVARHFASHPGSTDSFDWPVTPAEAQEALADFVEHRLPSFGPYQDAMWTGQPWLYHSRLSAAMNLKLLDPREVIAAAEDAYRAGHVPLASAEGFIRQILGWREYVRGIYWHLMPDYAERNYLGASGSLPEFYWTGDTEMRCLAAAIGQTLQHGYAHHIQRLMITGLYALLLGVEPRQVHAWYLAVYVDAVEWVELPNTLGMSQYADGGMMASKPYIASGKYIQRMSNYCRGCRFDPAQATGTNACPFTTLYWDFLRRHRQLLAGNPRMSMQLKNESRLSASERKAIEQHAEALRAGSRNSEIGSREL
ncbi:MAG: cryptochrome/photolyase family protein [Pirellulaceae bacterium]|nr:cryptochrome/photolyase family protein [Pirellulaceae bacterium]